MLPVNIIRVATCANVDSMKSMSDRLKAARENAGFSSAAKAAEALGISPSTYRAHENGQNEFGADEAKLYGRKFGINPGELLTGIISTKPKLSADSFDPDIPPTDEYRDEQMSIGTETGTHGIPKDASPQIDITAGLGAGGFSIVNEGVPGKHGMTFAADSIKDYWRLPPAILVTLGLASKDIAIFPVQGDSMQPTLEEGEVVFIDMRHRSPSPDGLYALLDDIGQLTVKRLEAAKNEDGEIIVTVMSDNPRHTTKHRKVDELFIVGRVLRKFGVVK